MKQINCIKCDRYVGKVEIELREELASMCLECFREETDQSGKWFEW